MRLSKRLSTSIGLLSALVAVSSGFVPASAFGALGDQLASFVPEPARNGRGLAISGSTAYVSSQDEKVTEVNLATHATIGSLETLPSVPFGFGALTVDPAGRLWGAEYNVSDGWVDHVDLSSGAAERAFNAKELNGEFHSENIQMDGLSADSDGTLWLKGEGDGYSEATIYHVDATGKVLGHCVVKMETPAFVVDGAHLWVAGSNNAEQKVYEYEKPNAQSECLPVAPEVSFLVGKAQAKGEPVEPEGLALDHCTFPGHLALWIYGASLTGGPLVAYDLHSNSDTTGCPPKEPNKEEPPKSATGTTAGGGSTTSTSVASVTPVLGAKASGGTVLANGSLLLEGVAPTDPTGLLFVYLWAFGDGSGLTGHGRVNHTYRCAGVYHVSVTDIDTTGARHTSTGELAVGFPRADNKTYRGLRFSPHVRVSGHQATLWLSWSGKGKHVSARSIDWKLDNQRGKHFPFHTHAVGKVSLGRNHNVSATAHFSNGHATTISACFHA